MRKTFGRLVLTLGLIGAIFVGAGNVSAGSIDPGVLFGGSVSGPYAYDNATLGYEFTANTSNVEVNALGALTGGTEQVGLWTESGTLLASATVTPADPVSNGFEWASITPVVLTAGQSYVVGAQSGTYEFSYSSAIVDPRITYDQDRWNHVGTGFSIPNSSDVGQGLISPPFTGFLGGNVSLSSVPEPSTFALLGLGGLSFAIGVYRRRCMAAV